MTPVFERGGMGAFAGTALVRLSDAGGGRAGGQDQLKNACPLKSKEAGFLHAKVLLVVQHVMVLEGLLAAIRSRTPLEVVGATLRPEEAGDLVESTQPDVVILGLEVPESGIGLGAALRQDAPGIGIVILAQESDDLLHRQALESGCAAVITFRSSVTELMVAAEAAAKGQTTLPVTMIERLAGDAERPPPDVALTGREKEILTFLAAGASTRAIADELTLSIHTVRNHVRNLLAKLQVHTRLEAVVRTHNLGLIDRETDDPGS